MNAFENINDLNKMYPVWGVHLAIFLVIAIVILGLAIFFFCKYRWWKHNYNIESSFVDALEIQIENDQKRHEGEINEYKQEVEMHKGRSESAFNDWITAMRKLNETSEQLIKTENRLSCAEGKIKKFETRVTAWKLAIKFCPPNTQELYAIRDKIWKDIKTS